MDNSLEETIKRLEKKHPEWFGKPEGKEFKPKPVEPKKVELRHWEHDDAEVVENYQEPEVIE